MSDRSTRPTIARIWRGRTKRERADEYEAYNYHEFLIELPNASRFSRYASRTGTLAGTQRDRQSGSGAREQ